MGLIFSILLSLISHPAALAALQADFTIGTTARGLGIQQGSSYNMIMVNITSLDGFEGQVSLTATVTPDFPGGVVATIPMGGVFVPASESGLTIIEVSTDPSTPLGDYTVTVTGTSGSLFHSADLPVTVLPRYYPPDFTITADPPSVTVQLSPPRIVEGSTRITVTSLYGFSGEVTLNVRSDPGPSLRVEPRTVWVAPGNDGNAILSLQPFYTGRYLVLINATSPLMPRHLMIVTFDVIPPPSDVARLEYGLTYNAPPVAGGWLTMVNRLSNQGQALIRVTALTFNTPFGGFSPSLGLPFNLTSGEDRTSEATIPVPITATPGNQTIVAQVEWQYYARSQNRWLNGETLYEAAELAVQENQAFARATQVVIGIVNLAPWVLPPYLAIVTPMTLLVVRRERRKQESLSL